MTLFDLEINGSKIKVMQTVDLKDTNNVRSITTVHVGIVS